MDYTYLVGGRPDFSRIRVGDVLNNDYTAIETDGTIVHKGNATVWNDQRFPIIGQQLNSPSGRVGYNYTNLTVDYQDNALYPGSFVGVVAQLSHERKHNSKIKPHLHWNQTSNNIPNILIAYKWYGNGDIFPTTFDLLPLTINDNVFTYTSGTLAQITRITLPDGIEIEQKLSSFFDVKIYRDTTNASGLFSGVDTYTGLWALKEFDIHIEIDTDGSREEFVK